MDKTFEQERAALMAERLKVGDELLDLEKKHRDLAIRIEKLTHRRIALDVQFRQMELREHEARNKVAQK